MPLPDETVVRRILATRDRGLLIGQAMDGAWATVMEKYPDRAWWRRKGTRAGLLWEHAVQGAIDRLDGDPGFKPVPHDDTLSLVFDQLVLVRLKKANLELRTSNYPTLLAMMFHEHEAKLPGFDDVHRVEAAYVLNRFETGFVWSGIVARERSRLLWKFGFDEDGAAPERLPLPKKSGPAGDRVMRPKTPDERKRESEEGE